MEHGYEQVYEEMLDEQRRLVIHFSAVDSEAGRPAYYWNIEFLDEQDETYNSETNRLWYETLADAETAAKQHFDMAQLISREEIVETYLDKLCSELEFSENCTLPAAIRDLLFQRQYCSDFAEPADEQITEIYTYLLAINWEGLYPVLDYA